jgi:lipoprotein-anchoring transpeptidase ErfK/SrfK
MARRSAIRNGWRLAALIVLAVAEAHAEGTQPERTRRIVVSIPDRKLALIEDGRLVKVYPAAVGSKATPTPAGKFTVVSLVKDPTWYGPKQVVPPGPKNPVGSRWIGINKRGYGIHGTNQPRSIGQAASHGCIRMRKTDLEELYELVRIGDVVEFLVETTDELAGIFAEPETMAINSTGKMKEDPAPCCF